MCSFLLYFFLLDRKYNIIDMSVFIKETNNGDWKNYLSECPERYKTGAISSLIKLVQIGIVLTTKLHGWNKSSLTITFLTIYLTIH